MGGAELPGTALKHSVQAADHKKAWEFEQVSVGTSVRKRIWGRGERCSCGFFAGRSCWRQKTQPGQERVYGRQKW